MKCSSVKSRILRGISPAEVSSSPQKHAASSASARKYRSENVDPNICVEVPPPKPPVPKARSPLPLRPPLHPGSNPLKRKLSMESLPENGVPASFDSGVKVVVRMRPGKEEEGEQIVTKISADSVSILDHVFTFDSVADSDSTQQDIFELVGVPLVENCLDGFNSSIFAYGQTGSGKTYTMWGPTNELLEEENSQQKGLTPRVFERLFSRINEMKHADKELTYQCRCSFLEIYNEQITDLLDPNQKNLQIREDVKSGVYVEDLTEECVYDMKDLTKLLIKGLTNRRTGATSINADSSRSHSVFTCVVESRSKNKADGVSSLRVSRINLVDLAGSERQKLTGAAGERLKEAGNINRSLSQLGNLINILAEVSQSGKQRHIPYRDSRLTFLLQESLGGNAKLAMICAISPAQSCKSETFSTLRFAQRAKAIKNKAMVNELRQEDVDSLREIIRQLRDELVRVKSNGNALDCNARSSTGWNARRSLSLLKKSLSHPMTMAIVDEDSDEEMEIDEEAVEKLCVQVGLDPPSMQDPQALSFNQIKTDNNLKSEETDVNMEDFQEEVHEEAYDANVAVDTDTTRLNHEEHVGNVDEKIASPAIKDLNVKVFSEDLDDKKKLTATSNLSIETCCSSPGLDSSLISVSPKVNHTSRKSPRMSSTLSASQIHKSECGSDVFNSCSREGNGHSPTQYLEASLNRGLQIIDSHCQNGALRRSSFRFPVKPVEMKPTPEKADVSVQTVWEGIENVKDASSAFICCQCKSKVYDVEEFHETKNVDDLSLVPMDKSEATTSLVPSDESHDTEKLKIHIPKAVEKVLAGAIRREMALEDICAKKTTEITHLNRLVQQYKHERECNAIIQQTREDKIHRLESLMDGVLPSEDFMDEEFLSLANEHKLLKEKYEYHPEVLGMKVELERVQDELDRYRNFFDMGEKDVLMEEIKDLRSQLQYYVDSSTNAAPNHKGFMLQLTYPCQHDPAPPLDTNQDMVAQNIQEQFEHERCQWTEMESKWISLSEELRLDLEASRSLAEKMRNELDAEKKCAEVLKEALQMAMQGHAHILDQYADLQEKHIALLARHRKIQDGIVDVKRAAAKAGVKGAESKFIDSLASEISALKAEREKERRYWRDENKGLQQQLRDTVEAVQAAGELLVRLKETEEAVAIAEKRALMAEQEAKKAKKENDDMKKKHEREMATLNQFLAESRLPKEAIKPFSYNETEQTDAKYDGNSLTDQRWREEFEPFCNEPGPSLWFSGYDQCNL